MLLQRGCCPQPSGTYRRRRARSLADRWTCRLARVPRAATSAGTPPIASEIPLSSRSTCLPRPVPLPRSAAPWRILPWQRLRAGRCSTPRGCASRLRYRRGGRSGRRCLGRPGDPRDRLVARPLHRAGRLPQDLTAALERATVTQRGQIIAMSSISGGCEIGIRDPAPLSGTISAWGRFRSMCPRGLVTHVPGVPRRSCFPRRAGPAAPPPPPVTVTMLHRSGCAARGSVTGETWEASVSDEDHDALGSARARSNHRSAPGPRPGGWVGWAGGGAGGGIWAWRSRASGFLGQSCDESEESRAAARPGAEPQAEQASGVGAAAGRGRVRVA